MFGAQQNEGQSLGRLNTKIMAITNETKIVHKYKNRFKPWGNTIGPLTVTYDYNLGSMESG